MFTWRHGLNGGNAGRINGTVVDAHLENGETSSASPVMHAGRMLWADQLPAGMIHHQASWRRKDADSGGCVNAHQGVCECVCGSSRSSLRGVEQGARRRRL